MKNIGTCITPGTRIVLVTTRRMLGTQRHIIEERVAYLLYKALSLAGPSSDARSY